MPGHLPNHRKESVIALVYRLAPINEVKIIASQIDKYAILYGRLSQEDARLSDSNSILNQRSLLEKHAQDNGFENALFLADDGCSGTNFESPSWKKVIDMIENGEAETLIVKDLSRLGREYLQVGYYTEIYFPQKGVRFIAVNDAVDSLVASSTDFNPIRNWANELHAKDTSKKVRAIKRMQAERGERSGGKVPYGYKKKSSDGKDIIPDEETSVIVQYIFKLCAGGKGPSQIARILENEQVLTPAHYYYRKYGKGQAGMDMQRPYGWSSTSVGHILANQTYLGHTHLQKSSTISYKNKTRVDIPENEQIIVKDTHEPLIDKELWDIVQDVRSHKRRPPKRMEEPNMFAGLVFCADCGKPMVLYRTESIKRSQFHLKCYTYGKKGKNFCTPHQIRETDLEQVVLDDLRRVTHFARMKEHQFAAYINAKNSAEFHREINALQKDVDSIQRRNDELTVLFKRLYEDNVLGRITTEQFRRLSADYNAEQKTLEEAIPVKMERLEKLKASAANVDAFIEKAKRFRTIAELTPELLRLFVQRIEIGERAKKYSHSAAQDIRIVYRDSGMVDSNMEKGEQPVNLVAPPQDINELVKMLA